MVDTLVLGTSAKAWEFESLHAQIKPQWEIPLRLNLCIELENKPLSKRLRFLIVQEKSLQKTKTDSKK